MSLTVKRKQIVVFGVVLSLAAALAVNWYYTRPDAKTDAQPQTDSTQQSNLGDAQFVNAEITDFSGFKLNRSKAQDEAKQGLKDVIDDANANEQSKKTASEAYERLCNNIALQSEIETLIQTKSGGEVFVSVGDTVEVVLQKGTLNDEICLQIKDIITNKTQISSEKITIIESK